MSAFRVIAVTSGKGGVGKTTVCGNLAVALAARGERVLAVDADLGLADLNFIFGAQPRASMKDVLDGTRNTQDVVVHTATGVDLLPACAGDFALANLSEGERSALFTAIEGVEAEYDVVVVDTGAGINANAMAFAAAASRVLVVVTRDPTSVADAYAVIKVLSTRYGVRSFDVLPNQVQSSTDAEQVFQTLWRLCARFLPVSLRMAGYLTRDTQVERALRACEAVVRFAPHSSASQNLRALAAEMAKPEGKAGALLTGRLQLFWHRMSASALAVGEAS